ncbi:acetyl esterase [Metarhizium album ARSEF 1941]|uniref:Acetyl esterase n=1 Tax=Metarhizium album (strain ARSEF 1941) TaxID=1081103 RepID=A0A0B2X3W5_METAS|nr:acetyl esterase [Metarhizium album ARSEF 1941]KHO01049.1 acetyl esterase [Metarhizium album ARSEF 1941]
MSATFLTLLAMALGVVSGPTSMRRCERMKNLVTFGDSYTDEGRLNYFTQHHEAPPIGKMLPPNNNTWSGGYAWGRLVANTTGANYYDYAVAGAQCTNNVDSRNLAAINGPFPSVLEYEIPTFEKDIHYPGLYPDREAHNTVYALWIGTNDLGIDGILGDKQKPGTTISTYVDCIWSVFDHIYKAGGRQFVLLNQAPLERSPMYATPGSGGLGNHQYWRDKTKYNVTEYENKIREYTTSVNAMYHYGAPFNLVVKKRWPGASISIFDVHSLMMDVINDPGEYLDAPADVVSPYRTCLDGCVDSKNPRSSFMWYDELHPAERMEEIFAKNFIEVVHGRSKYATYYTDGSLSLLAVLTRYDMCIWQDA